MVAMANKRVLVIGPEGGVVASVAQELEAGNTSATFEADHAIDWGDSAAVDKLFSRHRPQLLLHELDLRQPELRSRHAEGKRAETLGRARALAAACAKHDCVAMHLSDYHVFGGDTKSAYEERDQPAPLDSYGSLIAELEQGFAGSVERHIILRFSWLIDPAGENLFTRILSGLVNGDEVLLSRYRRGAPTWLLDARRVVGGVVRQVMSGAENWGCFHYCSADSCNEWEFGEEVESTLSELRSAPGRIVAEEVNESDHYPLEPASATLNTRRIRNNFGVHGRSWRQGLKAQISHWLDRQAETPAVRSSAS